MRKRNKFNLSHYHNLTCDAGFLVPISLVDVLPGDSFKMSSTILLRMSPMVNPIMHPIRVRVHHFFVPFRLLWDEWEDFITGISSPTFPQIELPIGTNSDVGTLRDYLGLPIDNKIAINVSALPFRAYNLIYNEFYRDQDLVDELPFTTDGSKAVINPTTGEVESIRDYTLQRVSWEKDYFTTSRPWAQKGPQVSIPVSGADKNIPLNAPTTPLFTAGGASGPVSLIDQGQLSAGNRSYLSYISGLSVNAKNLDIANINVHDLRLALGLQRYQEARANYGSRYIEYLRYAFGVRCSDYRLQRPEYLGGGSSLMQISEVLGTGENNLGNMAGHGIGMSKTNSFVRFFEEFGYIMSFMSILPKTIYSQGVPRHWVKTTKEDFFQKELQNIGMQEVYNSELAVISNPNNSNIFGYQSRYDEYRYSQSKVLGEFRTTFKDWHLARIFDNQPVLNQDFINSNPSKRIFASQQNHGFICMVNNNVRARRVLDLFSRPATF